MLATLLSGEKLISEFSNLGGEGQGYATKVFAGASVFSVWRVVGNAHPVSGETVLMRTQEMVNGSQIVKLQQVKPREGLETTHGFDPANFEPVAIMQQGRYGLWIAPDGSDANQPAVEGATPGVGYPVHRDDESLRRYVILRAQGEPTQIGGEPVAEVRHWLDAEGTIAPERPAPDVTSGPGANPTPRPPQQRPGDGDDDLDGFERL